MLFTSQKFQLLETTIPLTSHLNRTYPEGFIQKSTRAHTVTMSSEAETIITYKWYPIVLLSEPLGILTTYLSIINYSITVPAIIAVSKVSIY